MTQPKPKKLYSVDADPAHKPDAKKAPPLRPPHEITKDERKYWKRYAPELAKLHVITDSDKAALLQLCRSHVMYDVASLDIKQHGTMLFNDKGTPLRNPSLLTVEKAQDMINKLLNQFGMTPASRHKVSTVAAEDKTQDAFKDL